MRLISDRLYLLFYLLSILPAPSMLPKDIRTDARSSISSVYEKSIFIGKDAFPFRHAWRKFVQAFFFSSSFVFDICESGIDRALI